MREVDAFRTPRSRNIANFHGDCPMEDPTFSNGPYHPGHSKCRKRARKLSAKVRQAQYASRLKDLRAQQALDRLVKRTQRV